MPLKLSNFKINNQIERKKAIKFLGVMLDANVNWQEHMYTFENKIVKRIGLLYCPKCLLSKLFLNYIYFPYIHSYLNYVNISWASTYQTKLKAIHQLQK